MTSIDMALLFLGGAVFGFFLFPLLTICLPYKLERKKKALDEWRLMCGVSHLPDPPKSRHIKESDGG